MRRSLLLHSGVATLLVACVQGAEGLDASRDAARLSDADTSVLNDIVFDQSSIDVASIDRDTGFDGTNDAMSDSMTPAGDARQDVTGVDGDGSINPCVNAGIPRPFGTSCAEGLICDGAGACAIRRPCSFESAGRWLYPNGASRRLLETIFAYGRYYNFWINGDGTYEPANPGGNPTAEVPRWRSADGPCGGGVMSCSLASFNLFDAPDGAGGRILYESIFKGNRYWGYNVTAAPVLLGQGLIEGIPRYSAVMMGPCGVQPEGACTIDSRSLVHNWGTGQLLREEVTVQGRRWVWDGAGRPVAAVPLGQRLDDVARYAPLDGQGPCSARGINCRFDAHFHDPASGDEFVIAYGRLFAWASDAENTRRYVSGYGNELHTFSRYATGPCRVR